MKYKGKELDVFKSDENIAFNPPRLMLIWDNGMDNPLVEYVGAFCPSRLHAVIINDGGVYQHCAEIPKPRTNWDIYAKRNGITTSLDTALDVFFTREPECIFCPAVKSCMRQNRKIVDCADTFKAWATAEYKETEK